MTWEMSIATFAHLETSNYVTVAIANLSARKTKSALIKIVNDSTSTNLVASRINSSTNIAPDAKRYLCCPMITDALTSYAQVIGTKSLPFLSIRLKEVTRSNQTIDMSQMCLL